MLYLTHPVCTDCLVEGYGGEIDTKRRECVVVNAKAATDRQPIRPGGPGYRPFPPGPDVNGARVIDFAMAGRMESADLRGYPRHARSLTARALRQRILLLFAVMGLAATVSVVVLPGGLGHKVALTRRARSHPGAAPSLSAATRARSLAAAWIARWVSGSADVACDPIMCQALIAHGIGTAEILRLAQSATDPLDATIVVATQVIRNQFGRRRLATVFAPGVLASFGSGTTSVQIRVVAGGAVTYERQLRADVASRRSVGTALLGNSGIEVSGAARRDLAEGEVDARLLNNLATLSHLGTPLSVLGFGGSGPGSSPGMPLLSMRITPVPGHTGDSLTAGARKAAIDSSVTSILRFLKAQIAPLDPDHVTHWVRNDGEVVVQVDFGAPTQFGVFTGMPVETIPIANPPNS